MVVRFGVALSLFTVLTACRSTPPAAPCECETVVARTGAGRVGAPRKSLGDPAKLSNGDVMALERVIGARRSIRLYTTEPITHEDVMALLWAAQGVTLTPEEADRVDGRGLRAAPSAGATYPLETYLLANRVDGLELGLYHYRPDHDVLEPTEHLGDFAREVAEVCLGQRVVATAAAVIIFTTVAERTSRRYGERAERYINMELGHAAENAHLMATARGLGACSIGAFDELGLSRVLELPEDHVPTYLLTVGRPRRAGE